MVAMYILSRIISHKLDDPLKSSWMVLVVNVSGISAGHGQRPVTDGNSSSSTYMYYGCFKKDTGGPAVDLKAPKSVIRTNTVDCMRSGVMFGTACMLDGMIDKFTAEAGKPCKIIATGGLAPQMIENCSHEILFDENIILDGLNAIYKKNRRS